MKNFLRNNNRIDALMAILVLAIGSISGVGTAHFVMADQVGKVCVIFACQPTPNTATLIVTKVVDCTELPAGRTCPPASDFTIKITGVTASPNSFQGDAAGTHVTVTPGKYTVSEKIQDGVAVLIITFSGDCEQITPQDDFARGNINAGETQKCTITNKVFDRISSP